MRAKLVCGLGHHCEHVQFPLTWRSTDNLRDTLAHTSGPFGRAESLTPSHEAVLLILIFVCESHAPASPRDIKSDV
jgi:hypothetical protein